MRIELYDNTISTNLVRWLMEHERKGIIKYSFEQNHLYITIVDDNNEKVINKIRTIRYKVALRFLFKDLPKSLNGIGINEIVRL